MAIDDAAANVQMDLESIDIEDLFDRVGSKRDGYVDPGDTAWEMFEEALKPFQDEAVAVGQSGAQAGNGHEQVHHGRTRWPLRT